MKTQRERILSVYRGVTPDTVPFMLDLSHWFYHKHRLPWDLSRAYLEPDRELIAYHHQQRVGFYIANNAAFWEERYREGVSVTVRKEIVEGIPEICWSIETPLGTIRRIRRWSETTYSWHIQTWGVRTENDLRILRHALTGRSFVPCWDRYQKWVDAVDEMGVVYMPVGYSAMGRLLNLWMGVEAAILAAYEWPELVRETVDAINDNLLDLVRLVAESPAEIVIMGDNFSSDIQPPHFFAQWSKEFYTQAIRLLHDQGKHVAVHIDGRLRGAIRMIQATGADCGDALTPTPMGDLSPEACRNEAGNEFILSGGVPPDLWLPHASESEFIHSVLAWLALRKISPRLLAAAGDQVPPGAVESRIGLMRDLVEEHGKY